MKIPFYQPDISDLEIEEVVAALRSGWITTGPRVKQLERDLGERYGAPYRCVCLNSQTSAAELALRVLGIGPGDEVIVPAYTYTASASVAYHVGAKLVLIDSQRDSFEMDYDAMESAITERTKAIIPVDLGGVPCDYYRIFQAVENKRGLFKPNCKYQEALGRVAVCEDAAHALGATYYGKPLGSVADFASFSFHAVKNFTTGEGGAVMWRTMPGIDDTEIYRYFQLLSLHGQSKDAFAKKLLGSWEYDVVGLWYKCNMTDITAGIGLAQFQRYPGMLERRRELIAQYDAALAPLGVEVLVHYRVDRQSSGHLYITRVPGVDLAKRQEIIVKMAERDIACNVHYEPLPMHTAYKNLGFDIVNFPNAYARYINEITLPLYTKLTDEEVNYLLESFIDVLKTSDVCG
ncbi:MAG: DegT/DnrJ/EryC1/StrS family aminotransferase [Phoenicibacter congonensis]|uniref:DegT/DnrJ/EryC1/StrS family aminotransferase n=1 Tax=Phoenicibacter congonensis TaxID=1944646 RepID=A0AA43U6E9_9ACTN|nr:DegT/DnrJ/EryC1/StrS family aminotransferase [Phoenicibacter congonensis]